MYDTFSNFSAKPEFNTSLFFFEGYFVKGVKDVPEASTAFPSRNDNLLVYVDCYLLMTTIAQNRTISTLSFPVPVYGPNPALNGRAINAGIEMREMLRAGSGSSELHVYVNYAHGDDSLKAM